MNRPRAVRAMRIAWSAAWGIAAVLLIALWVGMYWRAYSLLLFHLCIGPERYFYVHAFPGGISAAIVQFHGTSGVDVKPLGGAPFWLLVPFCAALSIAVWIRWRFSMGAVIIAMTIAAAVLGSAAYLYRH